MNEIQKTGTLIHGLSIGDQVHKDFVMREATAGDYFSAEADATPDRPMSYRGALIARQLVRVGSFEGPFSMAMIGKLKGKDLSVMFRVQQELDIQGEDEQPVATTG